MTGLLSGAICVLAADLDFYTKEYRKLGVAEEIGISEEDLKNATEVLLDYTAGKREDMVAWADFGGETKEVFNAKEKAHMVDVRELFRGARNLAIFAMALGAGLLAALLICCKDRRSVLRGYRVGNYVFLGVFALIALYAATDFTSFWTTFHLIFFTNKLWLLDPNTCNLILMVPEQFFFDLVFRIVGWFVGIGAALYAGSWVYDKYLLKKGGGEHVS